MEIVHIKYPDKPAFTEGKGCALALGFFDGVHIGHQKILETTKHLAVKAGLEFAVMTFYPHPSTVIQSSNVITKYLTPMPKKQQIFEHIGVSKLYIIHFDKEFARLSHSDFVDDYVKGTNCKHAVAGFDFSYGYRGKGDMQQLVLDSKGEFEITTVNKMEENNHKISSTYIRQLLMKGEVNCIPSFLGEYYKVVANISAYQKKQNKLKLNVNMDQDVFLPLPGTYKVSVNLNETNISGTMIVPNHNRSHGTVWLFMKNYVVLPTSITIQFLSRKELLSVSNE
ncbi:FAD synthetase family protein [Halalkalibacter alkaliphilus]|uniref:FAD synthase n=1 Tax=Halalkalibacter alkaliphilus TaxID=2917993 RepID=A0A9X2CUK8_9BACI|nr:FAD synthetase family protein [Halalkalibacter alkaliphilus]MCL7748516.1 FAD synthetase family protein [Halalkalibacter alkaliphilus]